MLFLCHEHSSNCSYACLDDIMTCRYDKICANYDRCSMREYCPNMRCALAQSQAQYLYLVGLRSIIIVPQQIFLQIFLSERRSLIFLILVKKIIMLTEAINDHVFVAARNIYLL